MPLSAEAQVRRRARNALSTGKPFQAHGRENRRIVEEVRAELAKQVEQGKTAVVDAAFKLLNAWHRRSGLPISEGHIGMPSLRARREVLVKLLSDRAKAEPVPCVCAQIGLNAGHSAVVMLNTLPSACRLVSFQIKSGEGTKNRSLQQSTLRFLEAYAGKDSLGRPRHVVVWGDSKTTLAKALACGAATYDFIFIDGGHSLRTASKDLKHARLLSRRGTIIAMDDAFPRCCKIRKLSAWQRGPSLAWKTAVQAGDIVEMGCQEGLAWGRASDYRAKLR